MTNRAIAINRVDLTVEQLASLAEADRNLLFLAGHVLNELNSLNKVFAWCLAPQADDARSSKIDSVARGIQALTYARILAGKVNEAWTALKSSWPRGKSAAHFEALLHPDAASAWIEGKKYFGRRNLIWKVRNTLAFHYDAKALGAHWQEALAGAKYEAVFGGTIGNNLNLGAETVANVALLHAVGCETPEESLRTFFEDVQRVARQITTVLEGCVLVVTEQALGQPPIAVARQDSVPVGQSFSDVSIPYFCEPASEEG